MDKRTKDLQAPSTRSIVKTYVEPSADIIAERARATFDVQELSYAINGKENLDKRAQFIELIKDAPWADKSKRHFLTREEEYVGALRAALGIWETMKAHKLSYKDGAIMRTLVDFPGGLELHIGMFIPSILGQGNKEQQAHWLPKCLRLEVIGTYAQTELGHGTFVRGLETTATYDAQTQEFVLHSPTLTSTKWWPGGMGKTATHALVMARLFVGGKDYGPHGFIVQLRSLKDHKPLPGITIGDIGPKFGYGGVDNGYMSMDHVRIPRDHMLMRFAQVTPDGRYVPPPPANTKASYATMVFVRADIIKNAGSVLARAVTIATRYAAVRRQTAAKPGQLETQVLDYQNTAMTLLPLIANGYALTFMGEAMMQMYRRFEADRDKGDFNILPELHALSSGLKALCTWITADGIEACRRTCGGHGYSKLSGLPSLFQNYVQNVTWEGDNNVMCLQTARHLLKALAAAHKGQSVGGSAAYLRDRLAQLRGAKCTAQCPECWDSPEVQRAALQHAATSLAVEAAAELTADGSDAGGSSSGSSSGSDGASSGAVAPGKMAFAGPAWNNSTVAMVKLARAHCMVVLHSTFLEAIQSMQAAGKISAPTVAVLQQLCSLLATSHLETAAGDLMECGYMSGAQARALRARQRALLRVLRPNAVPLVDAFGLEDYLLNSALGRYDGDVYRALLQAAKASPLNVTEEGPAWEGVLKPVMTKPQSKL